MGLRGLLVRERRGREGELGEGKGGKGLGKGEGPTCKGSGGDVKGGERWKGKGERREGKGGGERRGLCSCKNSFNMPESYGALTAFMS